MRLVRLVLFVYFCSLIIGWMWDNRTGLKFKTIVLKLCSVLDRLKEYIVYLLAG